LKKREESDIAYWTKAGYEKIDSRQCEINPVLKKMMNIEEDQFRYRDCFRQICKGEGQSWVITVDPFIDTPVFEVFIFSIKGKIFPPIDIFDTGTRQEINKLPNRWKKIFKTVY